MELQNLLSPPGATVRVPPTVLLQTHTVLPSSLLNCREPPVCPPLLPFYHFMSESYIDILGLCQNVILD